ncbi:putative phospholipase C [Clostridium pasteurianum DSM 525 = ATCC 6013]|uniref:Phospholipase C n=1 Tax=Clostridium pasteurianum DSM 525 = ATCC 6013 TaxID=1262449 RepID=A0A0H3J952_CLOPA|nr:zinc dependent phospholipase C family protein [Clostridium pasteurianum]AJA47625.1 putative phospholipase C [Clostridium pasteurianum DSM 525 = ATCC 6013]AJA51613.1 putative phospholipase C [Clostridium pasteurianum DSM 525 = ATCC 6013]AOZ74936.1 phospholipase [Clostridium pasteurianum DSM 525 = ATCC 6013]AOZ78731.1 phospholipase [Clostridium pasteurianum]ELP58035.1 phospholipase C related protein [Clostridium pasteurianum DSM 525 = ATCC 6013]
MARAIERNYGKAVRGVMATVNPIKKLLIKTYCTVHKYINIKAIEIIKHEGKEEIYRFFLKYINELNQGVMWADQDFKSTNHFYHFSEGKGLYGFSNALAECKKYYTMALNYAKAGDKSKAMFYFGAACHLIQDTTVPQHVNNNLLNSHRAFEMWILKKVVSGYNFNAAEESIRYGSLDKYIKSNALMSNDAYTVFNNTYDVEKRYRNLTNVIIVEAEKTTAGFMIDFYYELCVNNVIKLHEFEASS